MQEHTNKKTLLFIFRGISQKRILDKTNEKGPFDFLFGYEYYPDPKAYIIAPRSNRKTLLEKAAYFFEKPFSLMTNIGIPIEINILFKKQIHQANYVFAPNDAISFGILFHNCLGKIKGKTIVLFQGLPEVIGRFAWNKPLMWFISKMLKSADIVLTLSKAARSHLQETFNLPDGKLGVFHFGVDVQYWFPNQSRRQDFLLSVGNDRNRDYQTLLTALPKEQHLKIVTRRKVKLRSQNIKLINGISDSELRAFYQTCMFTVIPSVKLNCESSGLSCILQAMACSSPVIASYTPGLAELFEDYKDILFYKPEEPDDLREKIQVLLHDVNLQERLAVSARKKVLSEFNTQNMSMQLEELVSRLT